MSGDLILDNIVMNIFLEIAEQEMYDVVDKVLPK